MATPIGHNPSASTARVLEIPNEIGEYRGLVEHLSVRVNELRERLDNVLRDAPADPPTISKTPPPTTAFPRTTRHSRDLAELNEHLGSLLAALGSITERIEC